ncbi:MAG: autotransporter outer membrane beta-barrel domain-containing protein [Planctomycetia bacterium]|nr:autotransporter outer membrane beta-barrel domain-containing protein [Planctomycetia bacterium]
MEVYLKSVKYKRLGSLLLLFVFFFCSMDKNAPAQEAGDSVNITSSGLDFSKDIIMRGSVSLPKVKRLQIWGNAYMAGGSLSPNLSDGSNIDFDNDIKGVVLGANISLLGGTVSGWYNYNQCDLDFNPFSSSQKTNLGGISYFRKISNIYISLLGNYGLDSYALDGLAAGSSTDFDGYQANGFFEVGFEMMRGGFFVFKPFSSLLYDHLVYEPESEKEKCKAFYSTTGARIDLNLAGLDTFTFQIRGAWAHQLLSDEDPITTYYYGRIPGSITPTQLLYEGDFGKDYFWGGAGLRFSIKKMFSFAIDYDLLTNHQQTTHIGSIGILASF